MNIERLHLILKETAKAVRDSRLIETVEALRSALQAQINEPSNAAHQQQVSKTLTDLRQKLDSMETSKFPQPWRNALGELGIWYFIGDDLKPVIDSAFSQNQITPSIALEELSKIQSELTGDNKALTQFLSALQRFDVAEEQLDSGQAEIGVLFPRESIDNELPKFTRELQDVTKIIKVFEEITTGQRRDPKINSIASSDLSVLLDIWPVSGAVLAAAVERIAAFYKQILEIKKLKIETKKLELPESFSKQLDAEANAIMEKKLANLKKDILAEYHGDKGRKNELEYDLMIVLHKIANKIDRGVHFEFRAGEPPAKEGETSDEIKLRQSTKAINEAGRTLLFAQIPGEQILQLPEHSEKATPTKGNDSRPDK